jgi:hypothetical protein
LTRLLDLEDAGLFFVSSVAFGSALMVVGLGATGDEAGWPVEGVACFVVESGDGSIFTDGAGDFSAATAGLGATITGAVGKG